MELSCEPSRAPSRVVGYLVEKPGWLPLLYGALPGGASDLFAIIIVSIAGLNTALGTTLLVGLDVRPWTLLLLVASTTSLAALSNTGRQLKEELAIFAYGSSSWIVGLRGFLRGLSCAFVALSPYILLKADPRLLTGPLLIAYLALGVAGLGYMLPALIRTRSVEFVENYKG